MRIMRTAPSHIRLMPQIAVLTIAAYVWIQLVIIRPAILNGAWRFPTMLPTLVYDHSQILTAVALMCLALAAIPALGWLSTFRLKVQPDGASNLGRVWLTSTAALVAAAALFFIAGFASSRDSLIFVKSTPSGLFPVYHLMLRVQAMDGALDTRELILLSCDASGFNCGLSDKYHAESSLSPSEPLITSYTGRHGMIMSDVVVRDQQVFGFGVISEEWWGIGPCDSDLWCAASRNLYNALYAEPFTSPSQLPR